MEELDNIDIAEVIRELEWLDNEYEDDSLEGGEYGLGQRI